MYYRKGIQSCSDLNVAELNIFFIHSFACLITYESKIQMYEIVRRNLFNRCKATKVMYCFSIINQ